MSDERDTYLNLVRAHEKLNRHLARFFEARGTTHQQYRVLVVLHEHDGREGLSCQEIGERMVNHVPDVTRLLDRLEKAGLVARARCKRDRRVVRTHLTTKGKKLVDQTEKPFAEAQRALLGGLTADELATLKKLLEKTSSDGAG